MPSEDELVERVKAKILKMLDMIKENIIKIEKLEADFKHFEASNNKFYDEKIKKLEEKVDAIYKAIESLEKHKANHDALRPLYKDLKKLEAINKDLKKQVLAFKPKFSGIAKRGEE